MTEAMNDRLNDAINAMYKREDEYIEDKLIDAGWNVEKLKKNPRKMRSVAMVYVMPNCDSIHAAIPTEDKITITLKSNIKDVKVRKPTWFEKLIGYEAR